MLVVIIKRFSNIDYSALHLIPLSLEYLSCLSGSEMRDLLCLLQFLTWLHLSDHRNFWNIEKYKSFDAYCSNI